MKFEELSAEELVTRALALAGSTEGDRCANELFERHYSRVAYWCLRFSGDRESAADLAQEIFARAHRALKDFQGHSKFSTWLYTITRNHCLNAAKSRSVRPIEVGEEALAELPGDDSPHPGERESSARLANQVLEEALDETEKRVFTLHYGDELTLAAITRLLGLTNDSGAKAYIVSAKRKLNRYLQRWRAKQQRGVLEEGEEQ
jgi:RNA polymerase sigma-70 factor (ECF subfamily)